jgi:hypothetical protein
MPCEVAPKMRNIAHLLVLACSLAYSLLLEAQHPAPQPTLPPPPPSSLEFGRELEEYRRRILQRELDDKNLTPERVRELQRLLEDPCAGSITRTGFVEIDMPWTVMVGQEVTADVSIQGCKDASTLPVEIRMEQTSDTVYEPRIFSMKPSEHQLVKIKVLRAEGGLAEIIATPRRPWLPQSVSLNTGFTAVLKARIDDTIEAGSVRPASFDFVDSNGKPVAIGAPVYVRIITVKAHVRTSDKEDWAQEIVISLRRGATGTPSFQIRAAHFAPDRDEVGAVVLLNNSHVLRDQKFSFIVVPQWWLQLAVGILGGLLHAVSKTVIDYSKNKRRAKFARIAILKLLTGVVAGCVAYLLASWNVLGIRIDTTSLRAFALLGFLLSYVGVDSVVRRLVPDQSSSPADHVADGERPVG